MEKSVFQFRDPRLIKLEFVVNPSFVPHNNGLVEFNTVYKVGQQKIDSESAIVALQVKIDTTPSKKGPFLIDAQMMATFFWNKSEITDTQIESLLDQNAPALLLSYLRPTIAFVTSQANFPPFTIPFMDFTKKDSEE